ncbi:hypothetical protein BKA93DRAFT_770192 [Sparassis latifolia]
MACKAKIASVRIVLYSPTFTICTSLPLAIAKVTREKSECAPPAFTTLDYFRPSCLAQVADRVQVVVRDPAISLLTELRLRNTAILPLSQHLSARSTEVIQSASAASGIPAISEQRLVHAK